MFDWHEVCSNRHYNPGYVYIAGSLSGALLKIGTTKNINKQEKTLRYKKYGDLKDWVLLYSVYVSCGGKVEHDARRELTREVRDYNKDGRRQRGKELVSNDFSEALSELLRCISAEERKSEWRSSKCEQYEFSKIRIQRRREAAARFKQRFGRTDVTFDPIHLMKIDGLNLSEQTVNNLKYEGIFLVGDLAQKTEGLLIFNSKLRRSLDEIKTALAKINVKLGARIADWSEKRKLDPSEDDFVL